MIPGRTKHKRDTENYSIKPEQKAKLWEAIVEAAKVVVQKGGAEIRFVPDIDDSERLQREMKRNGAEERTD